MHHKTRHLCCVLRFYLFKLVLNFVMQRFNQWDGPNMLRFTTQYQETHGYWNCCNNYCTYMYTYTLPIQWKNFTSHSKKWDMNLSHWPKSANSWQMSLLGAIIVKRKLFSTDHVYRNNDNFVHNSKILSKIK